MSALNEPLRFDARSLVAGTGPARVTLVGAGPGDPDLLTVKAARALREARVVLYDHLVGREVLDLVPKDAHAFYVGKQSGCHTLSQNAIIELMIRLARSGHPVVRLKGGDPFIFGRGGEEAQALALAGVPFEVVPGVSAAQGAAASVGIPLTHRDHACTLVFAAGHLRGEGDARRLDLDWELLARPRQTTVIYMGVATLPIICEQLIRHGLPPDTPAAVVERATRPDERTVDGTLETLPALCRVHEVASPALIVIGAVAALRAVLAPAAQACLAA
ncbi:MAG TPA: uroporphyrinogen-III C-methyltransferase [Burkholderiaceae bacterium]|nr:uroporphyrinogen-III C-methyltransferase [Burkholderiaceae bacterium]